MKRRFSDEQIISILREVEVRVSARELCRKHDISDATFYTWRKKFGCMEVPEVKRLKSLEEKNARLKKLLALKPCWIRMRYRWLWAESSDDRPEA